MEKIKNDLIQLARNRVPIDTEQLKASISGSARQEGESWLIEIFVADIGRSGKSQLSNLALGLVLEMGGKNGKAKRSQSQPQNPAGSPVAGWWRQFRDIDVPVYLKGMGLNLDTRR